MQKRGSTLGPLLAAAGGLSVAWVLWRRQQQPYRPEAALQAGLEFISRPRRVLAIGLQPGDLESFAGGTLRLLTSSGSNVTMGVLTGGGRRAGRKQPGLRETEAGAALLGATLVHLGLQAGDVESGSALDEALEELWRLSDPEVILAFDPKGILPLSRKAGRAAIGQAVLTRSRRGLADGQRVYYYGSGRPNVMVDITSVMPEKIGAVKAHHSQLLGPDWVADHWVKLLSRLYGRRIPSRYAEGLYRLV